MVYIIVAYWIVCGFASFALPDQTGISQRYPVSIFLLSMLLGGIVVPARFVVKVAS